jgi:hypothetical protein
MTRLKSKEILSMLNKSRIAHIKKKPMTAKEMKLNQRLTNFLNSRVVIEEKKSVRRGGHWSVVCGPGIYYVKYMKLWGYIANKKSRNVGKRNPG